MKPGHSTQPRYKFILSNLCVPTREIPEWRVPRNHVHPTACTDLARLIPPSATARIRSMNPTHFWLIRHGETEWNAGRRLQGWLDIPLSETGRRQARQLAQHLQGPDMPTFQAVLSSDLSRAAETAQLATAHLGLPVITLEQLRERNYGIYQGLDWTALTEGLAAQGVNLRDPAQLVQDGESFQQFADRITAAFEALAREYPGQNLLVFAHGGVVDIAWRKAAGLELTVKREDPILNASINVFDISGEGEWRIGAWNQVGHLDTPALDDVMHT